MAQGNARKSARREELRRQDDEEPVGKERMRGRDRKKKCTNSAPWKAAYTENSAPALGA